MFSWQKYEPTKEELETRNLIRRTKKLKQESLKKNADMKRGPVRPPGRYPTRSLPPLQTEVIEKVSVKFNEEGKLIPFHETKAKVYEPPPSPPLPPIRFIRMRRRQADTNGDYYPTMPCLQEPPKQLLKLLAATTTKTRTKKDLSQVEGDKRKEGETEGVKRSTLDFPEPVRNRNNETRVTYVGSPLKFNLEEADKLLVKKVNEQQRSKQRNTIKIESSLKQFWRCKELKECDIVPLEVKLAEAGVTSMKILRECSDRDLMSVGLRPVFIYI
jgi:hypothetical protein